MNRRSFLHRAAGAMGSAFLFPAASWGAGFTAVEPGKDGKAHLMRCHILMGKAEGAGEKPGDAPAGRTAAPEPLALPAPRLGEMTFEMALRARRSRRRYAPKPLGLPEVSALLFAAQGITHRSGGREFRTAPSAGGLHPFDIYLFAHDVTGLIRGLYRYDIGSHGLAVVREGDFRQPLKEACRDQQRVSEAAAALVMAAVFPRTTQKYGERGYRYVHIEAGCISQSIYLAAESMGLGTVAVGAFYDDKLNALLGLDGVREAALLVQPVGRI